LKTKKQERVKMGKEDCVWSKNERRRTIAILKKIALCQDKKEPLPPDIFEYHCRTKKNIGTDLVLLREREIYLIQRPTLAENPDEPYPEEWHNPGVTHTKWTLTPESLKTIVKKELNIEYNDVEIRFEGTREVTDHVRGSYLYQIFTGRVPLEVEPQNPKGRFFPFDAVPWDKVIASNRDSYLRSIVAKEKNRL